MGNICWLNPSIFSFYWNLDVNTYKFYISTQNNSRYANVASCYKSGVSMLGEYLPILIFLAVGLALAIVLLGLGLLAALSPTWCRKCWFAVWMWFWSILKMRGWTYVRYYLVAILFIIFDLEIAFLFPWAIVLDKIGVFGIVAMGIFLKHLNCRFYLWVKKREHWNGNRRHSRKRLCHHDRW